MTAPLKVAAHLTDEELEARAHGARARLWEWARWRAILLFKQAESAADIARFLGRKEDWVRRTVRSYNKDGPDSVRDLREDNGTEARVGPELMAALVEAVQHDEPPGGGRWTGGKAQVWLNQRLEKPIPQSTAYNTLHRAKLSWQVPRPRSVEADPQAQDDFKKKPLKTRSKR
jgi:transposase